MGGKKGIQVNILENKVIENRKHGIRTNVLWKNKDKILMNILNMKLESKQEKEQNEGGKKKCPE